MVRVSSTDVTEETEEAPRDDLREALVARVGELLGDAVVETHIIPGKDLWVRVRNEAWQAAAEEIRYVLGARYFCFLSAIDWLPSPFGRYLDAEVDNVLTGAQPKDPGPQEPGYTGGDTRFQVLARVANVKEHWGINLKADTSSDDDPRIATWTRVYSGADWHEREASEMYGINFDGHPSLRHLYLPSDFEGYPLRKDFPLLARVVKPWPGIVDVEPLPGSGEGDAGADDATAEAGS